jgi:hypothetical protein
MIALSVLVASLPRFGLGIAEADRIEASATVQLANPINTSRFTGVRSLDCVTRGDNSSALILFLGRNADLLGGCIRYSRELPR